MNDGLIIYNQCQPEGWLPSIQAALAGPTPGGVFLTYSRRGVWEEYNRVMTTLLANATLITPGAIISPGAVIITNDGKISYAGSEQDAPDADGDVIDLEEKYLLPGLIDVHVHGGVGISFGEGDPADELGRYSAWVTSTGVTGYLCSLAASDGEALRALVREYSRAMKAWSRGVNSPGAEPLGIHLEGPYLNPEKKGAFNPAWLRWPKVGEVDRLLEAGQGWIRQVTLAPELPEATEAARRFQEAGVLVALGHSSASYELASQALAGDFQHVTHAFNAQSGFHHRQPGVFGAVMASDRVTAELIADGVHVHPGAMKVLYRCLGNERVVLITDAMAGAGLPDGNYELVGNPVIVKDGQARLHDGTIAGSTATLNTCVWNMHRLVGVSLQEAVGMATLVPAKMLGLSHRLGSLEVGKDASLAVIGEDGQVVLVVVKGKVRYNGII